MAPAIIKTPSGTITSYRVAWQSADGRDVYTWRVDDGEPPYQWGTAEQAIAWMNEVWATATAKEIRERNWEIIADDQEVANA